MTNFSSPFFPDMRFIKPGLFVFIAVMIAACGHKTDRSENGEGAEVYEVPLKGATFITYNGKILDTLFLEGVTEKLEVKDVLEIDSLAFISYARFSFEKRRYVDLSEGFENHYLNVVSKGDVPSANGALIDFDSINFKAKPMQLGHVIGHTNGVELTKFDLLRQSNDVIYVSAQRPDFNDARAHLMIRFANNRFEKLFEIEAFFGFLNYKSQGDTAVTASYYRGDYSKRFAYDFKNEVVLYDTTFKKPD